MNAADKKFALECYEWLDKKEMTDEAWMSAKAKISKISNHARQEAIYKYISDLHMERHPEHFIGDDDDDDYDDDEGEGEGVYDSEEDEEDLEAPTEVDIGGFDLDQFADKGTIKDPEAATKAYLEWMRSQRQTKTPTMRALEQLVEFEEKAKAEEKRSKRAANK